MTTLATVFGYGLLSARAAASIAGRFYYATDTTLMYRDNGSTWDTLGVGSGSIATDTIWDAAGDLVQGAGADSAAKLSAGATGKVLQAAGASAALAWKYPPGYEFDYAQATSGVTVSATTEATANTLVTGNPVTYDGSQIVLIHFYAPYTDSTTVIRFWLYDGSSSIGQVGIANNSAAKQQGVNVFARITPSNAAHTYGFRASVASGSSLVDAGAGGAGNLYPMFMRITKVSGGA